MTEPSTHLVLELLAAALGWGAAFSILAAALHAWRAVTDARRATRLATLEPVLLDVLVGDAEPGAFAEGLARVHHADAIELVVAYALRLSGDSLATLGAAAAPLLPSARHFLHARRSDRRAVAVRVLGLLGTPADRPALARALTDRSPAVAMTAARALARTQDARFADALVDALGRFGTWGTSAVASMLSLYGPVAGPALQRGFADPDAPVTTRAACAEALRRLGYFPAACSAATIISPVDIDDAPVIGSTSDLHAAALRLLRDIGGPGEAWAVRPLTDSPDEVVRLHAISALAAISQEPGDAARIEYALADVSPWVAQRAARGLIESGRTASLHAHAWRNCPSGRIARQALAEAGLTAEPDPS